MKNKVTFFAQTAETKPQNGTADALACGAWNALVEEEAVTKPSAKTNKLDFDCADCRAVHNFPKLS